MTPLIFNFLFHIFKIDSNLIDTAVKIHNKAKNKYDLITNVFPRTFPKGQSVELIRTSIIKKNIKKFNFLEKEHVTKYFYCNSKKFRIKNFIYNGKSKYISLSVDTRIDLQKIYKKFTKKNLRTFLF